MQIPALVKIGVLFVIVLAAIRRNVSLGHVFLGASLLLGILFSMPPRNLFIGIIHAITHPKTISLAFVVSLILVLSHSMERAREMEKLLDSFQGLVKSPKINLVVFPALIGLLPMPGGAIFSAPMVKTIGKHSGLSGAQLSYINYWFRHVWEYWWPLYPGILLTTALSGIDLWKLVSCTFPLTVVALISGYFSLGMPLQSQRTIAGCTNQATPRSFLIGIVPIAMVIIGGLGLGNIFSLVWPRSWSDISKESGLIVALCLAILYMWIKNRFSVRECATILVQKQLVKMFYMMCSILVFKTILEESHAAGQITEELISLGIPLIPVCIILPFIMGLITGITIAFVGTSFPIIIVLIQSANQTAFMLPYLMLAIGSGLIGIIISPVHLCLLLSNEYFNTSLHSVYRYLVLPCAILFVSMLIYFAALLYVYPAYH